MKPEDYTDFIQIDVKEARARAYPSSLVEYV